MMLWNLYQQIQIAEIDASNEAAKSRANRAEQESAYLRRSVEMLNLTVAAVWELASEKLGITEDELMAKIQEIDLRDGKLDGKLSKEVQRCPACSRNNKSSRATCMYCGGPLDQKPFG